MKRTGLYIVLIAFLLGLWTVPASSQEREIGINIKLGSDSILIGDQIIYSLEVVDCPNSLNVSFPEFADSLAINIEILEKKDIDTTLIGDSLMNIKQDLLITCFDEGSYRIPGQTLVFEGNGLRKEFLTDEMRLEVLSIPLDTTQAIFDIKGPMGAPLHFTEVLPYLGILFLIGVLVAAWILINERRRRRGPGGKPEKPKIPPHITALAELDGLKAKKLWQNGKEKEYYSRISLILRNYLEGRYSIFALEQTSEEILEDLIKAGFNDNRLYNKLRGIFNLSDLAKFAKFRPTPDENETSLLDAFIFVNETKIEEIAKAENESVEESMDGLEAEKEGGEQ